MSVGVASAILASIVSITIAITVLFRKPQRRIYLLFSMFCGALFVWHAAAVANRLANGSLGSWQVGAALLLPPAAVLFFRGLLRPFGKIRDASVHTSVVGSGLLLAVNASPMGNHLAPRAVSVVFVVLALANILRYLYLRTRTPRADSDKKRLSLLLLGGALTLLLGCAELLPETDALAATGHVAATFYVYFLYQSIIARRLIDLVELLGKAAVLASLTLVLASIYGFLVLWVGGGNQGLWLFNTLVASFVILILYDQVRPLIEQATAKYLFRQGYELGQKVRLLLRRLRTTITLEDMAAKVVNALHEAGPTRHIALYLQGDGEANFRLADYRGHKPPFLLTRHEQPALLNDLRREPRPILMEHLLLRHQELPMLVTASDPNLQRELERTTEAMATMGLLCANLIVPIVLDDRIVGLICMGAERPTEAYSSEDLTAMLAVAEACAVIIENSQEYEKRRERDRLVVIGEMATGMAHEIRNPLGAIKGAAQCLDPKTLPPEAQPLLDVIVEEVDRLGNVVAQFLEYARPYRGHPQPTDVNRVLAATVRLLANEPIPTTIRFTQDLSHQLPKISIDPEHLRQVLINLIKNAIQAMPQGGDIRLSTSLQHPHHFEAEAYDEFSSAAQVVIEVSDSGGGISSENLPNIFVPFFTTKSQGTGLGLAISQRIVENASGRLDVRSKVGSGTTFAIRVPALPNRAHEKPTQQAALGVLDPV